MDVPVGKPPRASMYLASANSAMSSAMAPQAGSSDVAAQASGAGRNLVRG